MAIPLYADINASHEATGYQGRTDLPAFHIFTHEDTYPRTRQVMPPYRFGFYQMVLFEAAQDAQLSMGGDSLNDLTDLLTFASPAHVLAWVRGEQQRGFIVYFKAEFVAYIPDIEMEFPFFRLTEVNTVHVEAGAKAPLHEALARLLSVYQDTARYRVEMLQSLLLALLYQCKGLYEAQQHALPANSRYGLAWRFQQFVNQHFLTRKTVAAYADLLHVSADHLGETVKLATGKTAHHVIEERIVAEAKRLLRYTELNIAEIADYLGYSEPTHFGRFFRRCVGRSPHVWRRMM